MPKSVRHPDSDTRTLLSSGASGHQFMGCLHEVAHAIMGMKHGVRFKVTGNEVFDLWSRCFVSAQGTPITLTLKGSLRVPLRDL